MGRGAWRRRRLTARSVRALWVRRPTRGRETGSGVDQSSGTREIAKAPEADVNPARGVRDHAAAVDWLKRRDIQDVECIVPDQAGVARGKLMPTEKFARSPSITMPTSIFSQTISGDYPMEDEKFSHDPTDGDLIFEPDYATLTIVPWASDPAAQLIHDARYKDGRPVDHAPRQVLKRVIELYERKGMRPMVAPEIEFYLVKPNTDPDYPLEPPIGRSGRPEIGRQSFSIAAVNEFDDLFDDIYDYAEAQGLEIDTLIHEEGAAQMEINLLHGGAVDLADQVFLFKRTIREAALRHEMYATFMAKPMSNEPGSAMHIHASLVDTDTGRPIFSDAEGKPTKEFFSFIAGHQRYLPHVMCILAPYVNSYRRLERYTASPINVHWGYDNRTVGLRVPHSRPEARRLENRIPSSSRARRATCPTACRAGSLRPWRCSRSARGSRTSSESPSSPPSAPSSRPSSRRSCA